MAPLNPVLTTVIFVFTLQAIILSVLLVVKKPRRQSNIFLALLVFFFALMAFNIALLYVLRDYDMFAAFRYVQMELLFGIGPALFFYTRSVTDHTYRFGRKELVHFIPVVLEFLFYRTAIYRLGADGMYQTPAHPYTKYYLAEQWLGILSITLYTILSLRMLYRHHRWLKQRYSNLERKSAKWLITPVLVYAGFWIGWNILTEVDRFLFDRGLKELYFLPAFVGLAIVTYWIGLKGYVRTYKGVAGYAGLKPKIREPSIDPKVTARIREVMESEQPYLDPDLDLSKLSERLGMNIKQVSAAINRSFSKNFYEFVNTYRVEAFKKRVTQPDSEQLTLLGHALECGFNSKSTFNEVFKKKVGKTPSQYVREQKKRSG